MVEYIRHYWTLQNGLTRQRELANTIKKKIRNGAKSLAFLRGADEAVPDYAAIFNPEHPKWRAYGQDVKNDISTLTNVINIEQIVPLVFAVANKYSVSEAKKAFRLFVVWSVRFILGQSGRAGRLDKQYAGLANAVGEGRFTGARELREFLADKVPGDEAFARSVATAKVSKSVLSRYYLLAFEKARRGGSGELEPSTNVSKVNLEHILPQSFSKDLGMSKPEFDDLITRLGNQTVMQSEWNRDIGKLPFDQKCPVFAKSEITLTNELALLTKFDREEIDKRQEEMADLAPKVWSLKFG
ncbi:HNH endonuclease family protein [Altererythrobacter sp.]|nr:HNH endonuclease family protein [Altererythrobacter sp.]